VRWLNFLGTVEILVLFAIGIEVFALYKHGKLDSRMDEHIQKTYDRLLRSDEVMKVLDEHMSKFDEHLVRLDEHMNKVNDHITSLDEHLIRYDEHMNRLDDLILKSYFQRTKKEEQENSKE
jgi:hypothetical protein